MMMPPPRLKRDWIGLRVKTLVEMKNGRFTIAADTTCLVTDSHRGLTLTTEPCEHCRVSVHITRINEDDVQIIDRDVEATKRMDHKRRRRGDSRRR